MNLKVLIAAGAASIAVSASALERLSIQGKYVQHNGTNVFLQGANTICDANKFTIEDADNFKAMGMNFVRLLMDIDNEIDLNDSEGDGDYIFQSALDEWSLITSWFAERQIWVLVEMRSNDYDVPGSDFWVPGSDLHTKWKEIWKSLALTLKDYDYIGAWGILAEHAQGNRSKVKAAFQPIMEAIDAVCGTNTPFCFGPKLNNVDYYDRNQYTDWYWPEYADRIIYQINHLHPKPFIANRPDIGYDPQTWWYHRTDGQDGAGSDNDDSMHKAGNAAHLQPGFDWRDYYDAPIYVDQWGCALNQPGYLDYERDLIEIFRENGNVHHTRWTYFQKNERGMMTDYYGTLELHPPLRDFWTMALKEDYPWPHVVSCTESNAWDNHLTTEASSDTLPWIIDMKFSAPFACNKIELWNGSGEPAYDPATIEVYGSNDGMSWDYLSTVDGIVFTNRQTQYFSPEFTNRVGYIHYRAKVTENAGGAQTVLSNLEFFPGAKGLLGESFTLTVHEDTFCQKNQPDTNYGFNTLLNLRSRESNFSRVAFLKFIVTALPLTAELRLYSEDINGTVYAYGVADNSWTENSLTWSNMPATGALISSAAAASNSWFTLDLSSYITRTGTYSIALEELDNVRGKLSSSEGSHPPELVITPGLTGYQAWAIHNGLSGADAARDIDLENDGMNNGVEYALGGNPTNDDAAAIIPMSGMGEAGGFQWLEYIHRRRDDYAVRGLEYLVEANTNLIAGTWSTNGVIQVGSEPVDSGFNCITNRVSTEDKPRQFIRLRIESSP